MSSLLQFQGDTGKKGVRLEFVLVSEETKTVHELCPRCNGLGCDYCATRGTVIGHYDVSWPSVVDMGEKIPCHVCGGSHAQIYTAWRKPRGMWGCWAVFAYNGTTHVPDLSIPIDVQKLPRDARPLSSEDNSESWHRS